ncbi:SagB/ThcOx family dehydrogenase [Thermophagus sp. OGC60D27]|uniref:SagB/ThcOx family dehydrogenase n=1 Tax=Thermophagus sp. OGC60D27 TaxID=3458415 RepID=UPI00403816F0
MKRNLFAEQPLFNWRQAIERPTAKIVTLLLLVLSTTLFSGYSQTTISFPAPDKDGGIPLMQALNQRQSSRNFSSRDLSHQQLSNLCWAAWGFNRTGEKKRTAPSSMNKQEMELYVVMKEGAYRYNAQKHELELIKKGDLRSFCGKQDFVAEAPVNFIYVANMRKAGVEKAEAITPEHLMTSHANAGFIAQNTYLACASEGLVCVVRAWIDKPALEKALGLSPFHKVILGHTIGFEK